MRRTEQNVSMRQNLDVDATFSSKILNLELELAVLAR